MRVYSFVTLLSLLTISLSIAPKFITYWATSQSQDGSSNQLVAAQTRIEGDKRPDAGSRRIRRFA